MSGRAWAVGLVIAGALSTALISVLITVFRWVDCRWNEPGCRTLVASVATTARFFLDLASRLW